MDDGPREPAPKGLWLALTASAVAMVCAGTVWWAWQTQPVVRFELLYPILRVPLSTLAVLLGAVAIGWWAIGRDRTLPALLVLALAVGAIGLSVRPLLEQEPERRLYVFDTASGDLGNEIEALGPPFASAEDLVFVPDQHLRLVALDWSSGERRWRSAATVVATARVAPSAVTASHLHVIGTDAQLAAVALDDGSVTWARDDVVAVAARDATTVIALDHDDQNLHLVALDAATGDERWRTGGFPCAVPPQVPSCPNLPYDVLSVSPSGAFVADIRTSQLAAFDPVTGALRWQVTVPDGSSWPVAGEDTVVLHQTDPGGRTAFVGYDTATGAERWRHDLGTYSFGFDHDAGVLYASVSRSTGLVPAGTGVDVLAIDATTGAERWTASIDGTGAEPFFSTGIAAADGTVVVTGGQRVIALGASVGAVEWDVGVDIPGETRRYSVPGYADQPLVTTRSVFVPALPPSEPTFGG